MTKLRLTVPESESLDLYQRRTQGSQAAWEAARVSLPGGVSRSIAFHRPYPVFLAEGHGCHVTDLDGNQYVDFNNNYTTLVIGHTHPRVVESVQKVLVNGVGFGAPTEHENRLATAILKRIGWADQIRFCNSGTEATMFAIRLARAVTGRPTLVKMIGGYHGLHDAAVVPADAGSDQVLVADGVPGAVAGSVAHVRYNDMAHAREVLTTLGSSVAAVIVEPVLGVGGAIPGSAEFLQALRQLTESIGALLIVDEVMAFRLAHGGAHQSSGITPDLMTLGKLIGGGMPIGAVVGRSEVMQALDPSLGRLRVYHSGTFAGNAAVLAAGLATLEAFPESTVERLNQLGDMLRQELSALSRRKGAPLRVTGRGSLFQIHVSEAEVTSPPSATEKDRFFPLFMALLNRGMFITPRGMGCLSAAMQESDIKGLVMILDELVAG